MKSKIFFVILIVLSISGFWFRQDLTTWYKKIENDLPNIAKTVQDIKQEVIAPPPLRSAQDHADATLSRSGVINWTNQQRKQNGLPALTENYQLNLSAQAKVKDMFAKQYFEHVSPDGRSVTDLAQDAGYAYLVIGENLALGNFKDDQALVQAWMDSPGHRANILNTKYVDIGVAVGRGMFEEHMTWLAVQHFGRPASLCSKVDATLKQTIDAETRQLTDLKVQLDVKKQELDNTEPKHGNIYNQKVDEYNALVKQYNTLLEQLKTLTIQYNDQVNRYNNCVSGD